MTMLRRFLPRPVLLALLLLAGAVLPAASAADDGWTPGFGLVGADGPVRAAVSFGPDLYIGGDFDVVGNTPAANLARWDGSNWHAVDDDEPNGPVLAFAQNGTELYVAGEFTKIAFANYPRIARWDGSKWTKVGFGFTTGTRVNALAFYKGELYAGGSFSKAGVTPVANLAKWDGSEWIAVGDTDDVVHALVVHDDKLCAIGDFTVVGTVPARAIACWDGAEWSSLGAGLSGRGFAGTLLGDAMVVGGNFTKAGSTVAKNLARWTGAAWQTMDFPLTAPVGALGTRGGALVVGTKTGTSTNADQPWMIEKQGAVWTTPLKQPDGAVSAVVSSGQQAVVVGDLRRGGETVLGGVGVWDGSDWGPLAEAGQLGLGGDASAFAVWQGELYVAGSFRSAGTSPATLVARWAGDGWDVVGNLSAEGDDTVDALLATDDGLVAAGRFASIGGTAASSIARWNGVAWSPVGGGLEGRVRALAEVDGRLVAGGTTFLVGDAEVAHVASFDGEAWTAVGGGTDGDVRALALLGGDLVAGGLFAQAGGVAAPGVARFDGSAWHAMGGLSKVYALGIHQGSLVAGGAFSSPSRVARWNGSQWVALGTGVTRTPGTAEVNALASVGTHLFVGGAFDHAGGVATRQVARFDGSAWHALDPGFREPGAGSAEDVDALAVHDGALWLGGSFRLLADDRPVSRVARWSGCPVFGGDVCATTTTTTTTTTIPFVPECGDANANGRITATDALFALRASVGTYECAPSVCDANDSGAITASDSLLILRRATGQDVALGCPQP